MVDKESFSETVKPRYVKNIKHSNIDLTDIIFYPLSEITGNLVYFLHVEMSTCMKHENPFFYRQLNFPSEPGVASEILEIEPKSCLTVA